MGLMIGTRFYMEAVYTGKQSTARVKVYDLSDMTTSLSGLTFTITEKIDLTGLSALYDVTIAGIPNNYTPGIVEFDFSDDPSMRPIAFDPSGAIANAKLVQSLANISQAGAAGGGTCEVTGQLKVKVNGVSQVSGGETMTVYNQAGTQVVQSIITDAKGYFVVRLAPGQYIFVRNINGQPFSRQYVVPDSPSEGFDSLEMWS